uniref:Integrase zinc-binding domain-containing protein n=1 Tax=Nicotiana tabacum TaxID=4097 RepID=A0A1S4B820_TOBAC
MAQHKADMEMIDEWKERAITYNERLEYLEYNLMELEGNIRNRVTGCQNAKGNKGGNLAKVDVIKNRAESSLVAEVKEKQYNDSLSAQLKEGIHEHKTTMFFSLGMDDGTLRYQGRLCVPDIDDIRERIMVEAHSFKYSIHPGSTKTMYHDFKEVDWWNNMKRNVVDYVAKCLNCQQVKAEHQRPGGLAQI